MEGSALGSNFADAVESPIERLAGLHYCRNGFLEVAKWR